MPTEVHIDDKNEKPEETPEEIEAKRREAAILVKKMNKEKKER